MQAIEDQTYHLYTLHHQTKQWTFLKETMKTSQQAAALCWTRYGILCGCISALPAVRITTCLPQRGSCSTIILILHCITYWTCLIPAHSLILALKMCWMHRKHPATSAKSKSHIAHCDKCICACLYICFSIMMCVCACICVCVLAQACLCARGLYACRVHVFTCMTVRLWILCTYVLLFELQAGFLQPSDIHVTWQSI